MRKIIISAFLFTSFSLSSVLASDLEFKNLTLSEAKLMASQSNKDIFVVYSADWCLPCQLLADNVLSDERVTHILNHDFITIRADYDDIAYQEWFSGFSVRSLPTMSIVEDTGDERSRFEGNSNYEEFLSWLQKNNKQNRMVAAQYSKTLEPAKASMTRKKETKLTVIQFGAFSNYDNAIKLKEEVEKTLSVSIIVHEDDNSLFKVLFTQDLNQDDKNALLKKVQLSGLKYFIKS